MHFPTPEAFWNVAGGETRNEWNHWIASARPTHPRWGAGRCAGFPASPAWRIAPDGRGPVVPAPASLHHRLHSIFPPGHGAISPAQCVIKCVTGSLKFRQRLPPQPLGFGVVLLHVRHRKALGDEPACIVLPPHLRVSPPELDVVHEAGGID